MSKPPAVSVVIVVHNGAQSLPLTLDNLRAQSLNDFELILIDDGSTDHTWEFISGLAWQRLRAHRNATPRGEAAALAQALAWASGDYIARHGAGDTSAEKRLEKQAALLDRRKDVAAVGAAVDWVDGQGRVLHHVAVPTNHRSFTRWLKEADPFPFSLVSRGAMLRRQAVQAAGGYRESLGLAADLDLWLRLGQDHKLAGLSETLCKAVFGSADPVISRYAELRACAAQVRTQAAAQGKSSRIEAEAGPEGAPEGERRAPLNFMARRAEQAANYLHWAHQFEAWGNPAAEYTWPLWWLALGAWPFSRGVWEFAFRHMRGERDTGSAGPREAQPAQGLPPEKEDGNTD